MVILIKGFGGPGFQSYRTIEERNAFAKTHKVIADQTHFSNGWLYILSFYDDIPQRIKEYEKGAKA